MYLNCHTYFSLLYGTMSPEALFWEAQKNHVSQLVITDINNTSAHIEMLRICEEHREIHNLQVGAGIEFRRDNQLLYIGIARNNAGFETLNRLLSNCNDSGTPLPRFAPEMDDVFIIYPLNGRDPGALRENEFIGIRTDEVFRISRPPFRDHIHKMVILHPVTFTGKTGFNVHRLLRTIGENTLLSKLDKRLQARENETMIPEPELLSHFWQYPQIISNTRTLLEQCRLDIPLHGNKNKQLFGKSRAGDHQLLRKLAFEGFRERYTTYNSKAMQRLLHELDVIEERRFEAYFLITHDIIRYARHRNFAYVGRGSGANSMVAYCLKITEVDPVELDLYFERFLNPYRDAPPDFDIDFSWKDRDEIIRYLFEKHGRDHTALLATFNTFQGRSVLRELGKVFGLSKSEIDKTVDHPAEARNQDKISRLIFRYAERLQDIPRNLSIHAGGIVITDRPVYAYTATEIPPKGFPITHFDMYGAEDIGIHKFDILSQRGLGHIKDAVRYIEQNRGIKIDISRTGRFKKDPEVNRLLRQGRCLGSFYIESPAMRMLLSKLKCDNYITLVAASSIIRPGVARSGMMREYIYRHHNPGKFQYIHPKMGELMSETYGVMVYQEDVIKVAHHFAGLSLAEADILRRGMSGKFRSRNAFKKIEQKFFDNCRKKGYPDHITKEVWRQIESFSGYSFSKAHSASYAVESYQSLYLKAHFPLEFMVGVINNFGGFYKTEFYFHEARMAGARIEAPCVNKSKYLTSIDGDTIHIGFIHLKSLEQQTGQLIPAERTRNGPFKSLEDFVRRIPAGPEQINILIRIGAFRFTGIPKRELLWNARLLFGKSKRTSYTRGIFDRPVKQFKLPPLETSPHEDAFDELELLGFPLCDPFDLLEEKNADTCTTAEMPRHAGKSVTMTGYLVTTKNTHTKGHQLMHFGTFLDRNGYMFDTTHFPDTARKHPFRGRGFYRLKGKIAMEFGFPMLEVSNMEKLPMAHKHPELTG